MLGQKFQKSKNGLGIKLNSSKNSSLGNKIQPSNKKSSNLFSQNQEIKKSYLEK